jgi:hypothetical protein
LAQQQPKQKQSSATTWCKGFLWKKCSIIKKIGWKFPYLGNVDDCQNLVELLKFYTFG